MEIFFKDSNYSPTIVILKILLYVFEEFGNAEVQINSIEEIGDEFIERNNGEVYMKTEMTLKLLDFLSFMIRRNNINNLFVDIHTNEKEIINIFLEDSEILNIDGVEEKKIQDFIEKYLSRYLY